MFNFSKRLIYTLSNKAQRRNPKNSPEEKFVLDFSRVKKSPFDIKPESSYNAYLSNNSFTMGLKKPNCIAWVDIPEHEYQDHVIEAKIRLDSLGGYASTGLLFHIMDEGSYYLALVSSKGYFRLDVVKDSAPRALIAWTEISDFDGTGVNLKIIAYGSYLIFVVNDKWLGEASDDSISAGRLGFALASYETASKEAASSETASNEYTCKAHLDFFSVDARTRAVEDAFKKWNDDSNINAEGRLRLAETFAVMGESSKALDQINRAWKRRDEAIRGIAADYTEVRTRKELLLAARMSFRLGEYGEAEEYIDAIIAQYAAEPQKLASYAEGKEALSEKIKILNELNKFAELKEFVLKYSKLINKNINFYTMIARCYWELKDYKDSAAAWNKAFAMNKENGVYAANAANALELSGKTEEALERFIEAGKIFLKQDNIPELAALVPKLQQLGEKNWEAHALAGKWSFSIEDYDRCVAEFAAANRLRCAQRPRPKADPALYYLWGLVSNLKGRNSEAIRLLERAVKLAPDYGLFRFKLTEAKITGGKKDPKFAEELKLALKMIGGDPDGKMAAHAGTLLIKAGDAKNAKYFFDKANKEKANKKQG